MFRHTRLAFAMFALLTPAAHAQVLPCVPPQNAGLTPADSARIADFAQSRTRGLAQAMLANSAEDRQAVSTIFAAGLAPTDAVPAGQYQCRTIKLGGNLPLIAYGYFACSIGDDGSIDKTSASQRFSGTLTPSNGGFFYRGALHYGDEQPIVYGADPQRDQVGCLYEIAGGGRHFVLELPSPPVESVHDLIELVPAS